jgi:hypothetical protein
MQHFSVVIKRMKINAALSTSITPAVIDPIILSRLPLLIWISFIPSPRSYSGLFTISYVVAILTEAIRIIFAANSSAPIGCEREEFLAITALALICCWFN